MGMRDWMSRPVKIEEDEFDRVSAQQDVDDPVWPSAPLEPDVVTYRTDKAPFAPNPESPVEIRLIDGALDFLEEVAEEIFDLPSEPERKPDSRIKPPVLDVQERAATSWRAGTFDIAAPGGTKVVTSRDDRTRVVITNWGPGIAYLSHERGSGITAMNVIQVPVGGSRTIMAADDVYAYPAVPGTTQIVDVQDEYGKPE